ncbi:TIGR04438 family Trp-rich protein [Caldimonas thermodepolymerans]|jgi:small Trp-rich protein|uniref:Small Trp-rich protein n=1 Tax=Caldimonas thermodepolymerans TaxID=215580 RepID=A0A2S5T1B8_9BURK|nr:TIGR04438 family Trp-rich protein [Caldimonas thermodepolymerans]PPE68770.1 TIGR04438 family Trp-rich protein [Caldimonas thermodepolymerans]QPC30387.1 TIGR04438 family Trp-rich protein [Caldimonas thermodepolymerans]RDH95650.1 small Trp-rich protein [Caldimonas thermodepolymerans]TCP03653.1 small Trp-rich protein [Caldimonas thermodepolymerans]UZG43152.1 TIGR04438 family Trp-rich protein [Caldimonas thermodepolymerans]
MWFVVIGVFLILLKLAELGPVGEWSWLGVLWPFPCAMVWWWWADKTGYTKRKQMEKMEERKQERRRKNIVALGLQERKRR